MIRPAAAAVRGGIAHWFHSTGESVCGSGPFDVRWGRSPVARGLARFLGLPVEGHAVPVRVHIARSGDREVWTRSFGHQVFVTEQLRDGPIRVERVGVLRLRFRLHAFDERLIFLQEEAGIALGSLVMKLPSRLAPRFTARAEPRGEGAFHVSVRISAPLARPLLSYNGVVTVKEET